MFEEFPKVRKPLSKELEAIYSEHYKSNREGSSTASSLAQKMELWLHKQVAKDVLIKPEQRRATLEIGAGTLNQLEHEPEVGPYDIVEPYTDLYSSSPQLKRIGNIYADISEVPDDAVYDRIVAVATFEHVCNLPDVVARAGKLLNENGTMRISIPSEGTILWALGWKLTTGIEFKMKYGLDYSQLMRHEHVNTAKEIEKVLKYFFNKVECKVFGITRSISFYQFFQCSDPKLEMCAKYISQRSSY